MIFQEEHILPKVIVHIVPKETKEPISINPTPVIPPSQWSVDEVADWIKGLRLSEDYAGLVKSNHLNGLALESMKEKEDWKELGVTVFGDVRALSMAVQKLFPK